MRPRTSATVTVSSHAASFDCEVRDSGPRLPEAYIPRAMLLPLVTAFQLAAGAPPVFHGRLGQLVASAPFAEVAVDVDGRLDEPVWRRAAVLTGFSLYQPVDQRPSPDSTEVLVWHSSTALHFGIRAFEPHGIVRATLADRDRIAADDNVELHLDTFHDHRRAFVFIVNPLGVQADGTKNDGGGFIPGSNVAPGQNDLSADFAWESKGRLTEWGYEVEIRIPFSSLRYPAAGEQRWGLQVDRHVQHSGYEETWTPALKGAASFIAQAGTLGGLSGIHHGQVLEFNPELTNTVTGAACCVPAQAGWTYSSTPQLGGNIRWGIGSNLVVNGSVKPDFSQVEADASQIAADERFALFYPERRPFFVEGSDQFNVPNTLVYTRRIVRPDAAAKLTGKLGRADIAVLSALDEGQSATNGERPLVDILRAQQAFGEQSTAGLLYSERLGGGRENRLAGADAHIVFRRLYFAQFQGVVSTTHSADSSQSGPLWEAVVDRTGRNFGFHYNVLGIGPDFRADNGFVTRTGIVQAGVANRFTAFGPPGGWFERWTVYLRPGGTWRYDDFFAGRNVLEKTVSLNNQFTFRGGWSLSATPTLSNYAFDSAAYAGVRTTTAGGVQQPFVPEGRLGTTVVNVAVATPQYRRFAASTSVTTGTDVDFFEASSVRRVDYGATLDLRPDERLRVSATFASSSFTRLRDGMRTLTTRIPRLKAEYQVSRPVFVRVVAQYEANVRAPLLDPGTGLPLLVRSADGTYAASVERRSNTLRADFLFSYRPSPGTVFFAGYGNSLTEVDPLAFQRLRRTGDAFFLKVSYLLRTAGRTPRGG
jgi:hypothetical protein